MSTAESVVTIGDGDFEPEASSTQRIRRSASMPMSPLAIINRLSRKSASYDQLPEQPIRLSVLKLDGSSFDIEVAKTATVDELKQGVAAAFRHMPKKGPGKISWPHVWAHFCLSYDGQKLLTASDYIRNYGIKDGDQLHFVRHVSITYNLVKKPSKKRVSASKRRRRSSSNSNSNEKYKEISEEEDDFEDIEKGKQQQCSDEDGSSIVRPQSKLVRCLRGWFSYTRLSPVKRTRPVKICSLRYTCRLLGRCKKLLFLFRKKNNFQRNRLRED